MNINETNSYAQSSTPHPNRFLTNIKNVKNLKNEENKRNSEKFKAIKS